jgi:hypothetical protein
MVRIGPILALIELQLRMLTSNRAACLVLVLVVAAAALAGRQKPSPHEGVCYVLYWREDPWVARLRAEVPPPDRHGLRIAVRPVAEFADSRGLISYPNGTHSIQLRPPDESRRQWLIWYWYSGSNPEVLSDAVAWFWKVTQDHFCSEAPLEVRVSPLKPSIRWIDSVRMPLDLLSQEWTKRLFVFVGLFFCGCYLPALSLAQQREHGTIASLIATPVGWQGLALAMGLFHVALTVLVVAAVIAMVDLDVVPAELGFAVFLGAVAYLGVGLTLGSWCGSVASASAALTLYLLISGSAVAVAHVLPGHWTAPIARASLESNLLGALMNGAGGGWATIVCRLAIWASLMQLVGCRSIRLRCRYG